MKNKLTIIGAGITGLSAAYIAAKDGWDVTVLEGSAQAGGLMKTFRIGGNRLEHYYHHFFTNDAELIWMLEELEIIDKLEFKKTTMGIFRNNKIFDFNSPKDLIRFTPLDIMDKIRFLFSSGYLGKIASWQKWENMAALDWFYRYAGRKATDSVWRPLLEIKFGSHASRVPVAWMVGRLKQRMNSRKKTEEYLGYIRGSLQTVTDTLIKKLEAMGVRIVFNARLNKLTIKNNRLYQAETSKGIFEDGFFLSTIPLGQMIPLLKDTKPDYAEALSRIEYIGAVCTILELDRPLTNIYWLNMADTGFPFGGVIEHTNFISPEEYNGSHIVYLSKYYLLSDQLASASKREITALMLKPIKKINPKFDQSWIKNIYVFRTNTAATACGLNFSNLVPRCETPVEKLFIANMSHIYPDERSCNNAIRVAAQACMKIGVDSSIIPYGSSLSGKIGMD